MGACKAARKRRPGAKELVSGEPVLVDNTGRTWPRITKDNAAQHPYPSLRHCKERGPGTAPYCWYLQISGEPTRSLYVIQ